MTDPIADLLTRIRNGNMAGKELVDAPFSKIKAEILRILKTEGFIQDYTQVDERTLRISMKYANNNQRVITEITRISKPGCRVYCKKDEIPNLDERSSQSRAAGEGASRQPQVVETIVREQPKIGRNDKVTIKHVMSGENKTVKYKQAIPLIDKGEWVLVE